VGLLITRRRVATSIVVALAVIVLGTGAVVWASVTGHQGGDPSGRLMAKLTPLVRVVPGFETGPVPWSSFPCDSCQFPERYAIKVEPHWDSCDGKPGTFGWDPVVIQVGFRWRGTTQALASVLNSRLAARGWAAGAPAWADAGAYTSVFPPGYAPSEALVVEPPVNGDGWMALMEARPDGQLASGC
jgi:hypothetical protein